MTEKRFTIDKKGGVFYLFDNGNLIPIYDGQPICDLLNELAEENIELHIQNDFLKDENQHMRDLVNENKQLKSDNFNLNKTVECLDETVKEQCNKIDWADECGVRWEEEYNKWIGGNND